MPSVNEVRIMGHLVRDPEMKVTSSGTALTNHRLPFMYCMAR